MGSLTLNEKIINSCPILFKQSDMATYYAKRAFEMLRKEGPFELSKASTRFILHQLDPHHHRRFKFHTWRNYLENHIKYDAPPDPYRRITVEPRVINSRLRRRNGSMVIPQAKHRGIGRIRGGDWDTQAKDLEDTSDGRGCIIKGLRQRLVSGMRWEDTVHYDYNLKNYDKNKSEYDCVSEYLNDRMSANEKLYEKISKEGYQSGHIGEPIRPEASEPIESQLEVLVVISRNGNIYLFGGYHRFSIARILNLEIPVQVTCRHKQWQELRDEIHNDGVPENREELRGHPDLQDILD